MNETSMIVLGNVQEQTDVFQCGCDRKCLERTEDEDEDEDQDDRVNTVQSPVYSAGGAKDLIAFVGFILAYWIIYTTPDLRNLKQWLLAVLILCLFVDGLFSLYPEFHNTPIGYNYATGLVIFGAVAAISGLLLYYGRKRR